MRFGRRQCVATGFGLVVFLGFTAPSGPADFIEQPPLPEPLLSQADIASLAISPDQAEPAPPKFENPLITVDSADIAGDELLHDAVPIPVSNTIGIAPDSVIAHRKVRTLWMEVTAYCSCKKCCGPNAKGLTSSGRPITYNNGHFVAADLKILPYGTRLIVPGYNNDVPVEVVDRGGAIRGYHIDIFMPTHQQAVDWGKKHVQVVVME